MSKFKVGDRVRFVVNAGDRSGRVFSVVGLDRDGDPVIDDGECSLDCGHFSDWLELVSREVVHYNEPDLTTLTRRDRFAMAALTGLCAMHDATGMWSWTPDSAAQTAYQIADAMLVARQASIRGGEA